MSSHNLLVVQEIFLRVHSLQTVKQKLIEEAYHRLPWQLCDWAETFLSVIEDLQNPDVVSQRETDFPELGRVLNLLATLLVDIQDFVSPYEEESFCSKIVSKMIMNTDIQNEMKEQMKSFHARIQELQTALLSEHYNNSVNIKEMMRETIKSMTDYIIKDIIDHSVDIEYLKEL
jgi:hypothetical protein